VKKDKSTITRSIACAVTLCISLVFSVSVLAQTAEKDQSDILEMLTAELNLTSDQAQQLASGLDQFTNTLNQLKKENDKDKNTRDPKKMLRGVQKARVDYYDTVKKTVTPAQFEQFLAIQERMMKEICTDVAEIQLIDLQPRVGFTDEQLEKLIPVFSYNLSQFLEIASENAGKELRPREKLKVLKALKHNQKVTFEKLSAILTSDQLEKLRNLNQK
jgi:uncharacterized phage infection (PIP) family protein YhgE